MIDNGSPRDPRAALLDRASTQFSSLLGELAETGLAGLNCSRTIDPETGKLTSFTAFAMGPATPLLVRAWLAMCRTPEAEKFFALINQTGLSLDTETPGEKPL